MSSFVSVTYSGTTYTNAHSSDSPDISYRTKMDTPCDFIYFPGVNITCVAFECVQKTTATTCTTQHIDPEKVFVGDSTLTYANGAFTNRYNILYQTYIKRCIKHTSYFKHNPRRANVDICSLSCTDPSRFIDTIKFVDPNDTSVSCEETKCGNPGTSSNGIILSESVLTCGNNGYNPVGRSDTQPNIYSM